jgi:hypothetical protein
LRRSGGLNRRRAAVEQVVDEEGRIRPLDPDLERTLSAGVHVSRSATEALHARLAVLPVLEPPAVKVKTEQEDCPVSPIGEDCTLVEAGEGCEIVVAVDRVTAPDPGSRQVA